MSKLQQALVSLGIRIAVIAGLAILDFVSVSLTNGTLQLPYPAVSITLIGLLVSEADTWLVNYAGTHGIAVPSDTIPPPAPTSTQ